MHKKQYNQKHKRPKHFFKTSRPKQEKHVICEEFGYLSGPDNTPNNGNTTNTPQLVTPSELKLTTFQTLAQN